MRVGFLTALDARDRRSWSGIPYHMVAALEARGHEVVPIGPMAPPELRLAQALAITSNFVGGPRRQYLHTRLAAKGFARSAAARLREMRPDVVFAPAASAEIAALDTDVPIVHFSDATFRLLVDYHPVFTGLLPRSREEGDAIERAAIRRAAACVFATRWAAESAISDYGADPAAVSVAPFGANLDIIPSRDAALRERPREALRMLFLGVSWERKGGPLALDALRKLRASGIPAELTVCGCEPPRGVTAPGLRVVAPADKRRPEERARLDRMLAESHLMLLPTRNDCSPVVFSEAAAHGLPVVSTRTGGVADVVTEGETGILLPVESEGEAYANAIRALWDDPVRMARMRAAARDRYEKRLNWDAWAATVEVSLQDAARASSRKAVSPGRPIT